MTGRAAKRSVALTASVAVACLCGGLSACGEKSVNGDDPLAVVRSFNSALAAGDGKKACDLLTDRRRQQVNDDASAFGKGDCVKMLGGLIEPGSSDAPAVKELKSAELGNVTIDGNSASVEVTAPEFGTSLAQLEREGDGPWRVSESAAGF